MPYAPCCRCCTRPLRVPFPSICPLRWRSIVCNSLRVKRLSELICKESMPPGILTPAIALLVPHAMQKKRTLVDPLKAYTIWSPGKSYEKFVSIYVGWNDCRAAVIVCIWVRIGQVCGFICVYCCGWHLLRPHSLRDSLVGKDRHDIVQLPDIGCRDDDFVNVDVAAARVAGLAGRLDARAGG